MSEHRAEATSERRSEGEAGGREDAPAQDKWAYLRTVYPLNPGIPHYLDFPGEHG